MITDPKSADPKITDPKRRDVALVIDDSPETLRLLTDALDGAGMTVMVAMDGAAAMRIVEQITPDIVLLDAVMPGIDGFETCRRLKRDAGLSNVPVIFMTGLAETEHIVRGLEAGGVDYVTKPIVIEEMIARIRVHLANARLTQSARAALDVSGRFLLAVNRQGKILWATPQAQKLLSDNLAAESDDELELPAPMLEWLAQVQRGGAGAKTQPSASFPNNEALRLQYMGKAGPNEFLLRLAKDTSANIPAEFSEELGLTSREGEVLSWLSKGKTNRDIAQILGLSPRTVDKHLEQIYAKLGVENRTAAAAIAVNASHRKS
jgi:DNA-binding NarL/FixJ family response regulator